MPTVIVKSIKGGEKLQKKLKSIAQARITANIGFLDRTTYPDGTGVATVAYLNEYGGHNPPRPFLSRTRSNNIKKWVKGIKVNLQKAGISKASIANVYEMMAMVAVGDVKRTIADWPSSDPYPNNPATIKAKARRGRSGKNIQAIDPTRVLIDTGRMIGAVGYEVVKK